MTAEDDATIRRLVYKNLFGRRAIGLTLALCMWLPAVALVNDELGRARGGNDVNTAAWIAAAVLVLIGLAGVVVYLKGRDVAGSALYARLTSGAASIQTLKFVRILNRPFVHVSLGTGGSRDMIVVFHGTADEAYGLFTRIAPQAKVLMPADPRAAGPSSYQR